MVTLSLIALALPLNVDKQSSKIVGSENQLRTQAQPKITEEIAKEAPKEVPAVIPQAVASAPPDSDMDFIFQKESGNRTNAVNASSGACGLGQALPCSKLANVCPDWQTNRECQIAFFSKYAQARYGGWSGAKTFWLAKHWW